MKLYSLIIMLGLIWLLGCSKQENSLHLKILDESSKVIFEDRECFAVHHPTSKHVFKVSDAVAFEKFTWDRKGQTIQLLLNEKKLAQMVIAQPIEGGLLRIDLSEPPIFDNWEDASEHLLDVK